MDYPKTIVSNQKEEAMISIQKVNQGVGFDWPCIIFHSLTKELLFKSNIHFCNVISYYQLTFLYLEGR